MGEADLARRILHHSPRRGGGFIFFLKPNNPVKGDTMGNKFFICCRARGGGFGFLVQTDFPKLRRVHFHVRQRRRHHSHSNDYPADVQLGVLTSPLVVAKAYDITR